MMAYWLLASYCVTAKEREEVRWKICVGVVCKRGIEWDWEYYNMWEREREFTILRGERVWERESDHAEWRLLRGERERPLEFVNWPS